MFHVSVTRLRLRSLRFLPSFVFRTTMSRRQMRLAPGFVSARLTFERPMVFWTISLWDSADAMREFRNSGTHLRAMPHLRHWCDEASVAAWEQPDAVLPDVDAAHARMMADGRASKLNRPSPDHVAGRTASPSKPSPAPPIGPLAS